MSSYNIKLLTYIKDLETIGSTNYVNKIKNKYLKFIDNNKIAKKLFIKESSKINKFIRPNIQIGGDAVFGIAAGSLALIGLAFGIYKYINRPKCDIEYPIINE